MNRRSFLRMLSATGALALVPAPDDIGDGERLTSGGATDPKALADYEALNAHLWRVFAAAPLKPAILPFVQAQLNVLTSALQGRLSAKTHKRTCALLADLYQLGGEAFFDAESYVDAGHCYTLAASVAKEADAFDLWACAMTRHAFINVYERTFDAALPLLERAQHLAGKGDTSLSTRHWVQAVTAQTHAGLGQLDDCERALSLASEVNDLSGAVHNGGWLRFDGARLPEERGACYVELERPDLAEPALMQSLTGDISHRRRGTILADLAIVAAQRGDVARSLDYATDALDIAVHTNSGVVRRRLARLQLSWGRLPSTSRADGLNQQIAALKSGQH
jgi:tetratricopeptide (TPR) repeat protein